MSTLKEQYKETLNKLNDSIKEMQELKKDEKVQKYIQLNERIFYLDRQTKEQEKQLKFEEYASCSHILVCCKIESDKWEGRTYPSYGCIKCGLHHVDIIDPLSSHFAIDLYEPEYIMQEYLRENGMSGKKIEMSCDLELAMAIYKRINEYNPDISDDLVIKLFEAELYDIRDNDKTREQHEARIKKLSLKPGFNRWQGRDVWR